MSLRAHDLQAGPIPPRRNRRFPVSLWAVERNGEETYHHPVSNLSVNGMFLQKTVPIPVGTSFRVELRLPNGRVIRGRGTVVHATATEDGPGNGVVLSNLLEQDEDALRDYLANIPLH